jgi:hypothetical protein
MTTITARFAFDRETKGAVRFQETDIATGRPLDMQEAAIGTLYLRKSVLKGITPAAITVSIET